MSKQVNDQDGVQPTSADASQGVPKTTDKAASTTDATETSTQNTPPSSTTAAQNGAKNSRSRRRGKSSPAASSTAASSTTSTAKPANTSSSSAASPKPTSNKSSAGTTPPTGHKDNSKGNGSGQSGGGKNGGSKSGRLAVALVIILAIALVFVAWQGWQRLESQQQRLNEVAQQAEGSASQQTVSDLESRLDSGEAERDEALQSTLDDLRGEFDSYRSDVDETLGQVLDQLSQEQDTDEREWLHAEAAYLLRLANQRLQLEGDVDGSAALLRTADARLVDADNPALTPVREAIANELAALDAVPQVDRTGLYLALNAQQGRISSLRLSQEIEERAVTSSIEQPPTGTFQRQLARFGEELKDLVVVRHHDEALEALITPEQESYLRQSLRLVLEQTQLALLNEEKELYDASIGKALQLLNDYYDTTREETQSVITRLQELKEAEVKPELPDISASQQALARFIDNRYETRGQSGGDS